MKITIDRSKCVGAGLCVASDPAVFAQSEEDGLIVVLKETPGADHDDAVREAEMICPARVIELEG
jgi:ferredoxin